MLGGWTRGQNLEHLMLTRYANPGLAQVLVTGIINTANAETNKKMSRGCAEWSNRTALFADFYGDPAFMPTRILQCLRSLKCIPSQISESRIQFNPHCDGVMGDVHGNNTEDKTQVLKKQQ